MSKSKRGSKENPLGSGELAEIINEVLDKNTRSYKVTSANLVDGYCNYGFEIIDGVCRGDGRTGKGSHVVKDDLRDAFAKMNVHLAVRDDIFKHAGVEVDDIDQMHGHELATLYSVTGFKMGGSDESESIVLIGNKYVSGGDRFSLTSPKIMIDNLSSYKWWNELKDAADIVREEVALYMEGKYIEEEEEIDVKEKAKQGKITFGKGKLKLIVSGGEEEPESKNDFTDCSGDDMEGDELNTGIETTDDEMLDFEKASV